MECKNCLKELPQNSQFCPYCLQKFTEETIIDYDTSKASKRKHTFPVIVITVLVLLFIFIAVLLHKANQSTASELNAYSQATSGILKNEITEGEYYVTDEQGNTTYPPATYVVVVDEQGNTKEGFILSDES